MRIKIFLLVLIQFCFLNSCIVRSVKDKKNFKSSTWQKIEPYFNPPAEYENRLEGYRSPLLFYNGDTVNNAKEWEQRRSEIRSRWMDMMGQWPDIIKNQEFEVLEIVKREDFTQQRVRFYWTPQSLTEGYLLIPDKKGKKPAVITGF